MYVPVSPPRNPTYHQTDSPVRRVKGQVIIITGANSPLGIGRASAHQFAHNGALAIYICDFNNEFLETHERELNSLYPDVDIHARQFDASEEKAVKGVIDEAVSKYGRLDIFFANAGIVGTNKLFSAISDEEFMKTLRTNVLRYTFPPPIPLPRLYSLTLRPASSSPSNTPHPPCASPTPPNPPPPAPSSPLPPSQASAPTPAQRITPPPKLLSFPLFRQQPTSSRALISAATPSALD